MAGEKPRKEVAQAYVRVLPIVEGLSKAMSEQIDKAQNQMGTKSKRMGNQIAQNLNEGLKMLNASGFTQTLTTGMSGAFSGAFRSISSSAFGVWKSMGSTALRTLGSAFRGASAILNNSLTNAAKTASVAAGGVLAAGVGLSVSKGLSRAMSMTEATAKMKGLGYEGKNLAAIMKSASDSVDGLAFSTGDAATAASGLLASGVKPGEELTKVLRTIGDTASLSGREFGDISSIFNKVFASGIIQGEEFNQLMDSGVPVLQYLSKSLNMSVKDVKKLASAGKISSAQFAKAMEENVGGIGEKMAANSFSLSAKNVSAQLGRVFEPIFTTAIESAIPVLGTIRTKLKAFVDFLKPVLAPIQENIKEAFGRANTFVENFDIGAAFTRVATAVERFKDVLLPVSGLIIGMSGSLLSSIPVIGGLFSGLTGPVGLLFGLLASILTSSDKLRSSLGRLAESLVDLFNSVFNVNMDKFDLGGVFKSMGDSLANGVDFLTGFVDSKSGEVSGVMGKMWSRIINPETIATLKSGAGKIFESIGNIFSTIFAVVLEVATDPRIRLAGAQIVDAFGSLFSAFSALGQKNNIGSIASAIASTIAIAVSIISTAIELIADVSKTIIQITSTPAFHVFAAWLKGTAQILVQSSGFIKAALVTLAVAFAGFKVFGMISKISAVFNKFPGGSGAGFGQKIADLVKGLGKGVAAAFKAIPGIAQAFVQAAPHLIAAIAVAAVILLELGTIGHILSALKVGEGLAKLGQVLGAFAGALMTILKALVDGVVDILVRNAPLIAGAITGIVMAISPILNMVVGLLTTVLNAIVTVLRDVILPIIVAVVSSLGGVLNGIANVLISVGAVIYSILDGLANLLGTVFAGIGYVFDTFATSVSTVISSLVNGGHEAAAAAFALAAGIGALQLAMAGGTLMNAAAGFGAGILKGVTNAFSSDAAKGAQVQAPAGALDQILSLVSALQSATDIISTLQTNWSTVATQALTAGTTIVSNMSSGLTSQQFVLDTAMATMISNVLANAQTQLDNSPLQVRMNVPSQLSASSVGSMNFSGQTSNTQNNEFNISNPNPLVVANAIQNMMR